MSKYIEIPHIGKILKSEFLEPLKLSQNALAKAIGIPANRINNIVNGKLGISADTDLRLTVYFGLSEGYFLRMQDRFGLLKAKREISKELNKIIPISYDSEQNGVFV